MFCSKCGNEVQDGTKFCSKCGAQLDTWQTEKVVASASKEEVVNPIAGELDKKGIVPFLLMRGRINRGEWWRVEIAVMAVALCGGLLMSGLMFLLSQGLTKMMADVIWFGVYGAFVIGLIFFSAWASVRRFHDMGVSGWWYAPCAIVSFLCGIVNSLSPILPKFGLTWMPLLFGVINTLFVVIYTGLLGIKKGMVGPNKYGPQPL